MPLSGVCVQKVGTGHLDTVASTHKFNAVVAAAGSWAGGGFPSASSPPSEFEEYLKSSATMLDTNLKSAVFAAGLATRYLGEVRSVVEKTARDSG